MFWKREDPTRILLEIILKEIRKMSTGLTNLQTVDAALAQAISDNTTATNAAVADIQSLVAQLAALNSEDPAVQSVVDDLNAKLATIQASTAALTTAVTPPVTTPPASSTPPVSPSAS